jgi:beta-xylosidase
MKLNLLFLLVAMLVLVSCTTTTNQKSPEEIKSYFNKKEFSFTEIKGIGFEKGCTRRDNSDIIKVGKKYFVYYTKVFGRSPGYWGTIWAAISEDEGHSWTELGEVLGVGEKGNWDRQAVFTPNIISEDGVYYLYYTAVQPTPGNVNGEFENNSSTDFTAIGVATSNNPAGPFIRFAENPVVTVSGDNSNFDSYRVDDAVLLKKDGKYWLYYKGRKYADGKSGPAHTNMGVAFAEKPVGPFKKYKGNPILDKSHEVFVWKQNSGIACLASLSSTFEFAADGLDFTTPPINVNVLQNNRPNAPGAYRPDLTGEKANELTWGISMIHNKSESYLVRWELIDKK